MVDVNDVEELANLSKEDLIYKCRELVITNQILQRDISKQQQNNKSHKLRKKELKQRPIDFNRYNKCRVALKFLYLGWDYQGLASQENTENTIEEELFTALLKSKLIQDRATSRYSRCGRTDKGVSAFGQVIALDLRSNLKEECHPIIKDGEDTVAVKDELPYVKILNRLLPSEIRVLAHANVDENFDARFSCKTRKYKYFFPSSHLDIHLMHAAAQKLVGEKDFRNFCKVDVGNNINHFIRNIISFEVKKIDGSPLCVLEVVGLAFLWHQVRCMAAVLLLVGLHHEQPEIIDYLLDVEKCPKRPQYGMASEIPLVLFDCDYEGIEWIYEKECNENNINRLEQLWTHKAIQSMMLKSMLDELKPHSPSLITSAAKMSALLPGYRKGEYKPLKERHVCEGLDRHLEKQNIKRIKLEQKYQNEEKEEVHTD